MLGKTNITTLSEGGTAAGIEDFSWRQVQSGTRGDFTKAICKGGYLAGITADGSVAYTADGEVWEFMKLEYAGCRLLDIDWDGDRFILVGSCMDESVSTIKTTGLIVATADFRTVERIDTPGINGTTETSRITEYSLVSPQNGKYVLIAQTMLATSAVFTDFMDGKTIMQTIEKLDTAIKERHISAAKNTGCILAYVNISGNGFRHVVYKISHEYEVHRLKSYGNELKENQKSISVFECKDALYFLHLTSNGDYSLNKVTDSEEIMVMRTGQNFMFVDGAYIDGCQVFINSHEMLVVKKGESLADKTTDDLKEIAPEFSLNCIVKAFGQIYIFGNQGVILKSSVETGNENAILVQALSAKKALADAKAYADEKCGGLEARIAALEAKCNAAEEN